MNEMIAEGPASPLPGDESLRVELERFRAENRRLVEWTGELERENKALAKSNRIFTSENTKLASQMMNQRIINERQMAGIKALEQWAKWGGETVSRTDLIIKLGSWRMIAEGEAGVKIAEYRRDMWLIQALQHVIDVKSAEATLLEGEVKSPPDSDGQSEGNDPGDTKPIIAIEEETQPVSVPEAPAVEVAAVVEGEEVNEPDTAGVRGEKRMLIVMKQGPAFEQGPLSKAKRPAFMVGPRKALSNTEDLIAASDARILAKVKARLLGSQNPMVVAQALKMGG